jgi:hypothetical protein
VTDAALEEDPMIFPVVLTLAVVALALVVLYVVREQVKHREVVDAELHDEGTPTLEYAVPTGQDPAVILSALETAGYTATVDPSGSHQVVMVHCPGGRDRERAQVRNVIRSADVTAPDDGAPVDVPIRFRDET